MRYFATQKDRVWMRQDLRLLRVEKCNGSEAELWRVEGASIEIDPLDLTREISLPLLKTLSATTVWKIESRGVSEYGEFYSHRGIPAQHIALRPRCARAAPRPHAGLKQLFFRTTWIQVVFVEQNCFGTDSQISSTFAWSVRCKNGMLIFLWLSHFTDDWTSE